MSRKTNSDQWRRKIHVGLFRRWYAAGVKMTTMAYRFDCTVQSLKQLRRELELPARPPGAPRRGDVVHAEARMDLNKGDLVVVTSPENPVFYGMPAWVEEPTPWGAILAVPVFHHGKPSTRVSYRALFSEMTLYHPGAVAEASVEEVTRTRVVDSVRRVVAVAGYTGDVCMKCCGARMIRSGACLLCGDCGETTGCG